MNCGTSIPLSQVVEAIINGYGEAFANEIIHRMDLSRYVLADSGLAHNITLTGEIKLDESAKKALCSHLAECIRAKIDENNKVIKEWLADQRKELDKQDADLGKRIDDLSTDTDKKLDTLSTNVNKRIDDLSTNSANSKVTSFAIDDTDGLLTLTLADGTKFSISKQELTEWVGGGQAQPTPQNPKTVVQVETDPARGDMIFTHQDGSKTTVKPPVTIPEPIKIKSGLVTYSPSDQYHNPQLEITMNNGETVKMQLARLAPFFNYLFHERRYDIYRSTLATWNLGFPPKNAVLYLAEGINERVLIAPPPRELDEVYVGRSWLIRRSNTPKPLVIEGVNGATINPPDISPLRRNGNAVTLVYAGNNVYEAFGELP